ncbi:PP2C family protein-serine/threonine phosphatase [Algoriphagus namhaensis]|uniref:PP2C family protein-serine/threonine phosphatase n=1 Tax=Algoriphagus namhaensis TaxID=915353 RepID=A0ABV8ASL2_9BACT
MNSDNFKYQRKELELKALLEITQAINENQSESVLCEIFKFTCLVHLNIKSLLLYVAKDGDFEKRIQHGVKASIPTIIPASQVKDEKSNGKLRLELAEGFSFEELETYLPVYHKERILAILLLKRKDTSEELDLNFTQALSNILVVALENKRFARKQLEQEVLNREVAIASNVQQMLFPASLPYTEHLKAKVTYFPFRQVGGDYYDLIIKNDKTYFCIADVSGKGISASLLMSNFQAALRTLLRSNASMETVIHQLNSTLYENTKGDRFITFFLGCYRASTGTLTYANAGHNPPLLCLPNTKDCQELNAGTTILGGFEKLPFLEIETLENVDDFYLHMYTDGLTEALDADDQEYGEERLKAFVTQNRELDPKEFHTKFMKEVKSFTGNIPLRDDLTMLSLKIQ